MNAGYTYLFAFVIFERQVAGNGQIVVNFMEFLIVTVFFDAFPLQVPDCFPHLKYGFLDCSYFDFRSLTTYRMYHTVCYIQYDSYCMKYLTEKLPRSGLH